MHNIATLFSMPLIRTLKNGYDGKFYFYHFKIWKWRERKKPPMVSLGSLWPVFQSLLSPLQIPACTRPFSSLLPDAVVWVASVHSLVDLFVHSPSTSPGLPFRHGLTEQRQTTPRPDSKSWARQALREEWPVLAEKVREALARM